MKICIDCGEKKEIFEFNKKLKYFQPRCKKCEVISKRKHNRTINGLIRRIYNTQKNSSKIRIHNPPDYSFEEFSEWITNQVNFTELYNKWVNNDFDKNSIPSVDRKDNNKGYSLDNIQLMTWGENKAKGHSDMRKGLLKHGVNPQKPVIGFNIISGESFEYPSSSEAARQNNIKTTNILSCCNNKPKYNTAGGFTWKFKN